MNFDHKPFDNEGEAIRQINTLVQQAKQRHLDVLGLNVGEHLNPGDVYDAYLDIGRKPTIENVLEHDQCGPFAAIFLQRFPDKDPSGWREYLVHTFDPQYVAGFYEGFQLIVPEGSDEGNVHFLRGVYDGVMAHAAVF